MADTTRTGIDWRGAGDPDPDAPCWRLRMTILGRRYRADGLELEDAKLLRRQWRKGAELGVRPDAAAAADETLAHYAGALLGFKRSPAAGLRPRGVEHWQRSLRPWLEGELAPLPLSMLRRGAVEDWYYARAVRPVIARNELEALKATLRLARDRGATIDPGILTIERIKHERRELEPFVIDELEQLAHAAPPYAVRAILLAGTTGLRWGELAGLEDAEVDLAAATITLPPARTKERRRKVVALTAEEVTLLREQLAPPVHAIADGSATARYPSRPAAAALGAAGSPLVFPTKTGRPWRHWQWLRFVWYPARARAADQWRAELELELDARTPYCDRKPHDLRATAIVLMLDAGMTPGAVATRVGHNDGGALIAARYDRDLERRRQRAARELEARAGAGLRAAGGLEG